MYLSEIPKFFLAQPRSTSILTKRVTGRGSCKGDKLDELDRNSLVHGLLRAYHFNPLGLECTDWSVCFEGWWAGGQNVPFGRRDGHVLISLDLRRHGQGEGQRKSMGCDFGHGCLLFEGETECPLGRIVPSGQRSFVFNGLRGGWPAGTGWHGGCKVGRNVRRRGTGK